MDFFGYEIPIFVSGPALAHLIFSAAAIFLAAVSLILFFHWKKYGMGGKILFLFEIIYLLGALFFLSAAFFSIN